MATVLVIEDEGVVARLVDSLLEQVPSGVEVLRYRSSQPPNRGSERGSIAVSAAVAALTADGRPDVPPPGGESIFRLEGEYWTIGFAGRIVRLRSTNGLYYVARLLRNVGKPLLAIELVRAVPGRSTAPPEAASLCEWTCDSLADPEALRGYRRRLTALQEEIDEAAEHNDLGRLAAARDEFERLADHVSAATGLGGRARRMPSISERARQAVTKGIRNVVARIGNEHPPLARHLTECITTGYVCSYRPDPERCIAWQL